MSKRNWKFWQKQVAEKSSPNNYGNLWPMVTGANAGNVFKAFLNGGSLSVNHRLAYTLYDRAAPLSSAVNRITDAVAQLEPFVIDADDVKVDDSALLDVLNNPGFGQTRKQIIEDFTLAFLLTNNAYWITDTFRKTLRTSKPFNVDPRANTRDAYVDEYRVTSANGAGQSLFAREKDWTFIDRFGNVLLHTKTKTKDDGLEGRSPIESIFTDIGQRISGGTHNLAMLQNGQRPSGMLSTEADLDQDQFDRLKEQTEAELSGSSNAGSFLLTEGGLTYTDMAKTNREMDYVKIISSSSESIALSYKVPLPLVVTTAQTLDNFSQATMSLYDDAVFPTADIVFGAIAKILQIEEGFTLTYDKNEVPAIRQRRLNEAKTKHGLGAFSDNETRVDLATEPYPGGDVIYKAANLIPVGSDDGALDQGEIEGDSEKKEFLLICKADGMSDKEAKALWSNIKS